MCRWVMSDSMIFQALALEFAVSLGLLMALFVGVAIGTLRKLRNGLDYLVQKSGHVLGK